MKIIFLSLGMLFLFLEASTQIVTEGNIAKYYFNNGNANNDLGVNNDGVIFGAVLTDDRFGNPEFAFDFNTAFIRIDHDEDLDLGSNDFSISAWFKTDSNDAYNVIFNKGEGTTVKPRIFIRTVASPESTFQWRVGDGVSNVTATYTDPSFFDDNWHHVVLVKEQNKLSFYLDANLVDLTADSQLPFINTNSDRPIFLGVQDSVYSSSGDVPLGNYFDGALDDYRIYNRAINDLEVDSLYQEGDPLFLSTSEDKLNQKNIRLYPNPVVDYIHLTSDHGLIIDEFEIFDSAGKLVLKGKPEASDIDVKAINPGGYFIRLYHDDIISSARFVKAK